MRDSNTLSTHASPAAGDSATGSDDGPPTQHASSTAAIDQRSMTADAIRCETCGVSIGPDDYRLSLLVLTGGVRRERHFCRETCLEAAVDDGDRSSAPTAPRDLSYCR